MTSPIPVLFYGLLLASQGWANQGNNHQMEEMVDKMIAAKMVVIEEKMEKLEEKVKTLESEKAELTTKMMEVEQKSLKDIPYVMSCAFVDSWTTPDATITYDRLTADYNNADRPGGGNGNMDINTGKFTAITPGHYTITFSGFSMLAPGDKVNFHLVHNNKYDDNNEGNWSSTSDRSNGERINNQGSRSVVSV